jgi:cytochrome P450
MLYMSDMVNAPCTTVHRYMLMYCEGAYVRIAPEEVHTADFEAFKIIHRVGSPWNKGSFYQGQFPSQTTDKTSAVFFIRNNKTASPRRRLFQSAGTRKNVAEWEPQIRELVDFAVQKIVHELSENGASDVLKWWHLMTSDITGSLAFGKSFQNTKRGQKNSLIHDAETLMPILGLRGELPFTSYIMDFLPAWCPGSAKPLWKRYKAYGEEAVQATRLARQGTSKTLFSKMVSDEASDQAIPDSLIEKEAANVIIAGTDTTAVTLTYLVWLVVRHPEVKQKLVDELQSCTTDSNWEELEGKRYLDGVIKESMRLYPVVPGSMTRVVPLGAESALRYKIPAGTQVGTQPWTFQRDPTVFEDPLR